MKYGYARVSTEDQNRAMQLAALKKAGCKTVFKDEVTLASRADLRAGYLCQF
jgi:DNA invertase Pin-like site-specific DNA recombinase